MNKIIAASCTALFAASFATSALAAEVSITPSVSDVIVGDVFTLDVVATNFDVPTGGATIGMNFDSNYLNLVSIDLADDSPFDFVDALPAENGSVDLLTLLAPFSGLEDPFGDFSTFTMTFEAVAEGNAYVSLFDDALDGWMGSDLSPISVDYFNASVNVSAVPVPAAVWMLGSGLIALFGLRRKTK
ncbi:MAG: VPLPA-CTERM sorting domain-containing protein [Pseudomonadales bacterium]|nr:VPLPA-CTERM sorting domain-containing protein [Pseudomonadales bacterium]